MKYKYLENDYIWPIEHLSYRVQGRFIQVKPHLKNAINLREFYATFVHI